MDTIRVSSGYLDEALFDFEVAFNRCRAALRGKRYDTIVGTGLSGDLVVPELARRLRKHWLIVRKENGKNSHSSHEWEGEFRERWVFVDDFISSGATLKSVHAAVARLCSEPPPRYVSDRYIHYQWRVPIYVGAVQYHHTERNNWVPA